MILDGQQKSCQQLIAAIENDQPITLSPAATKRIAREAQLAEKLAKSGQEIYGVTTNLGYGRRFVKEEQSQAEFEQQVLSYGQEHSAEQYSPLTLLVRLQTLLSGRSGVSPWIVEAMIEMFNNQLRPALFKAGAIGSADLGEMGQLARVLINHPAGRFYRSDDPQPLPAVELPREPGALNPRDPLIMVSSNAVSLTAALQLLDESAEQFQRTQDTLVGSMLFFRGNPSPFAPEVIGQRRNQAERQSAEYLYQQITSNQQFREPQDVQDPLSFRSAAMVHASLLQAIWGLRQALEEHINSSEDNPTIEQSGRAILSSSHFDTTIVANAVDQITMALVRVGYLSTERTAKLSWPEYSAQGSTRGPGAASRSASALLSELRQAAFLPSNKFTGEVSRGVEDWAALLPQAITSCQIAIGYFQQILTLERRVSGALIHSDADADYRRWFGPQ